MRKNKTIPTQGQFSDVIGVISENFNRQYLNLLDLDTATKKFCGLFQDLTTLQTKHPYPVEGCYAYINNFAYDGATFPANAQYDPTATYFNVYQYNGTQWTLIGVTNGAVSAQQDDEVVGAVLEADLYHNQSVGAIKTNGTYPAGTRLEKILSDMLRAPVQGTASIKSNINEIECDNNANQFTVTITLAKNDNGNLTQLDVYDPFTQTWVSLLQQVSWNNGKATLTYTPASKVLSSEGTYTFSVRGSYAANGECAAKSISTSVSVRSFLYRYYGGLKVYKANGLETAEEITNAANWIKLNKVNAATTVSSFTPGGGVGIEVAIPVSTKPTCIESMTKADIFSTSLSGYKTNTIKIGGHTYYLHTYIFGGNNSQTFTLSFK